MTLAFIGFALAIAGCAAQAYEPVVLGFVIMVTGIVLDFTR